MKIGELARQAGCTTDTIRFYEKEGLLPDAERNSSNYRRYGEIHLNRLRFIRNCRALDMSHDEIRKLLDASSAPDGNCGAINDVIDEHIEHVVSRIEELNALKSQLVALRNRCPSSNDVRDCGIVRGLGAMEVIAPSPSHSHV